MADQAQRLRQWIREKSLKAQETVLEERAQGSRVVAVTSGKGGVGKSQLTLNLALALAQRGQRVVILDADLGLANINILMGYEPSFTLWDVVQGAATLTDVMQKGPLGIRIIPGASGISALASLDPVEISGIIEGFQELESECDWLLVDTGAGIAANVLAFVLAADEALVVSNPEPPALADAYGLIKAVWEAKGHVALKLVMNRSTTAQSGEEMAMRIVTLAMKVLDQKVEFMGTVHEDPHAKRAISRQEPLLLLYPASPAATDIGHLADRLIHRIQPPKRGRFGQFVARMTALWPTLPS
ncbi:MAG: MinD/ParA family protein [Sulfobacillus thermosulfidooxidans]|uniref:Cobyrinic acid a,c-diamide synthase n=1 Tax=Sulfobacillus thermotolerans TaxID=338644 RepID=A0ABM6RU37_9FIRM|nr:cobyrinic acid a,c-diamide synthase [Sulfobacillus thermotolerans]MCY0908200.1 MinD/ParA family protein [Sulfobacillus thermotolerans]PSR36616.1 MAG: MinD/ParA family protein [Sulfobacillus thermosulfidooxidans]